MFESPGHTERLNAAVQVPDAIRNSSCYEWPTGMVSSLLGTCWRTFSAVY